MYSYSYSNLDKLKWLAETLKKGFPFRQDSNEPPLRSYQLWKKTFYKETHKIGDMTELPKSLPKKTYEGDLESEIVMVKIPRCMPWLGSSDTYDEPIVYTQLVTYPKEEEETLGFLMEVEPLKETQLEDLGLNTCNHDIPLSSMEVPSFDELEPQPKPLPNYPSLDVSLGEERSPEPPTKPNCPESFRMKSIFSLCYLFRNPFSSTTMGDENPIRTLGDYSKPSHEGYRNTIELPIGNNVVPLRSDTIQLVQNGCSFYRL
ncbi:hypothetical protein Tco_0301061 [Tanacetum coccineum]